MTVRRGQYNAKIDNAIARALHGDQSAYAALYDQYAAGLYRLCYSLLMDEQDAEDILQESFLYAFKNLHRYDSRKAALKTWLYTIAVSRCRNTYRRKRFLTVDISQWFGAEIKAPAAEAPEVALMRRDASDSIMRALGELSPRLREAIVLRYGQGMTYREIGEVVGCPQKTAESRVRLGHQRLRQSLQTVGMGLLEELLRVH
ncbi:MAG: sigma-70 family RNA polymerase sigma factor [Chloroflexi bacterium]|nr:sigma-70 family RNA polymerase sigma factor [Chloroflexota bacterium]MCY3582044.1 sigma-70 family RNA polymerase sigma factor [Chloroflexota bacterium]MCY3715339.1 sigma-70 family RNA polymerase sigma factor [Chloroflexota bacterium]MDE2649548.1 sigma-70 family RNA polymerase sigma factor [Chloroflexota bacterium]MYA93312.1 sigma-70 family RNA polymerase sigma factor [Chloroflexota bacterium]